MIEKRKVRIMMVNTNNLIIIIMKTTKNYLVFGVLTLCSLFFLAGCNSDGKLRESLNEYVNDMKHQYFPSGKFVFDENVKDMNFGKITIEMLSGLRDEGLITYTVLENQGSIYAVDVNITEEGLKYAKKVDENLYSVSLHTEKIDKILKKEFNEDTGIGSCHYSTVYDEVTPFGKIIMGIKSGDVCNEKTNKTVKKIDGVWQAEWPSWKEQKKEK